MAYLVQGTSMQTIINLTDQDIYEDIKQYLESFCPCPVLQGYPENSPPPLEDFVYMNILFKHNLFMKPITEYDPVEKKAFVENDQQVNFQLDFYGPGAEKNSSTFEALWKNDYSCDVLKKCQPLNVISSHKSPIINQTNTYERRYVVTATLQYNPVITHDQEFIEEIPINISHVKGS